LLLDALVLAVSRYLKAEGERDAVEGILVLLVIVGLQVLEELVLGCDLVMVLKVVHHLAKVVA